MSNWNPEMLLRIVRSGTKDSNRKVLEEIGFIDSKGQVTARYKKLDHELSMKDAPADPRTK